MTSLKKQVDSAIRFTATESDMKSIRAAFEAVNPGAKGWRKPDDKSVPEYEYYSPLARDAFYNFRDGWLAAKAVETVTDPAPIEKLAHWLNHDEDCDAINGRAAFEDPCSCGLDEAIAGVNRSAAKSDALP